MVYLSNDYLMIKHSLKLHRDVGVDRTLHRLYCYATTGSCLNAVAKTGLHHWLNVINDKFIVAQNVQNNKQMDCPPPSTIPLTIITLEF